MSAVHPLSAALCLALAACTSSPTTDSFSAAEARRDEAKLAAAAAHAAAPVHTVRFLQPIDSIEIVGPQAVLVWEKPYKAWLVDLRPSAACTYLDRSVGLSIDTMSDTLNDSNGWIEGDHGTRCRIERIREVDVDGYRAALRESGNG
jgi:hypothetical protein